jgi:hypothetical protein
MNSEIINAFLVNEGIRPAMFLMLCDYKDNLVYILIIETISLLYPNLIHTKINDGLLLSKNELDITDLTSAKLGQILGYPSFDDFNYIIENEHEESCTVELIAELISGKQLQILANRCKPENLNNATTILSALAVKATDALLASCEYSQFINKIDIEINHMVTPNKLIELLMTEQLSCSNKSEIMNLLWNLGFNYLCNYEFDYSNPFHKGILMTLLTHFIHNPLEPFFPLHQWPNLDNLSTEKTEKWEKELLRLLN